MPSRGPQLDQTTQTDLLYGLSAEGHATSATLDPEVGLTQSLDELPLETFNGASDAISQHAATRDDSSLHHQLDGVSDSGSAVRKTSRWRYADGIAPRPYAAVEQPVAIVPVEPKRLVGWQVYLAHGCWLVTVAWLVSFCIHATTLPVLMVLTIPEAQQPWGADVEGQLKSLEILEVGSPIEIAALPTALVFESLPSIEISPPGDPVEPQAAPGWMEFQAILGPAASNPTDEIEALFVKNEPGKAEAGKNEASEVSGSAQFFNSKGQGTKFVFVVDCSTSMEERDRWTHACRELDSSISRLTADQLFYVVFFDGNVHRMFNHDEREAALFPATEENKTRVREWLMTARLGPETRPYLAMKCALNLQPDVIFLLTDGDFNDPTAEFLKQMNRPVDAKRQPKHQVVVNTINFHNRSLAGQAMLKRIARENGGRYTFVPAK